MLWISNESWGNNNVLKDSAEIKTKNAPGTLTQHWSSGPTATNRLISFTGTRWFNTSYNLICIIILSTPPSEKESLEFLGHTCQTETQELTKGLNWRKCLGSQFAKIILYSVNSKKGDDLLSRHQSPQTSWHDMWMVEGGCCHYEFFFISNHLDMNLFLTENGVLHRTLNLITFGQGFERSYLHLSY